MCWVVVSFVRWGRIQNFRPLGSFFIVEVQFVVEVPQHIWEHVTTVSNSNASCFRVGLSWVALGKFVGGGGGVGWGGVGYTWLLCLTPTLVALELCWVELRWVLTIVLMGRNLLVLYTLSFCKPRALKLSWKVYVLTLILKAIFIYLFRMQRISCWIDYRNVWRYLYLCMHFRNSENWTDLHYLLFVLREALLMQAQ